MEIDNEIARTKISESYLTTVPKAVRMFLKLNRGDEISWQIRGGNVIIVNLGKARAMKELRENCEKL